MKWNEMKITLISTPSTFSSERRMGRPIKEGKIAWGKFAPAKPHFTNYNNALLFLLLLLFWRKFVFVLTFF